MKREQEAFAARYQLVGVQEEVCQVQEQLKLVEQERDALRTIAQNEEIARIAAEGRIPLPTLKEDDEFASPKKGRKSLDMITITSSAASEEESPWISPAKKTIPHPIHEEPRSFARTPSCEPPAAALISDTRTSLLSLFDAPQSPAHTEDGDNDTTITQIPQDIPETEEESPVKHSMVPTFHTISTTTRIPLANPPDLTPPTILPAALNPALSPTMSREEALAMIRERRGRARSLAQGTMTPRKQMVEGAGSRRDISAPAIRSGGVRGRSQARS